MRLLTEAERAELARPYEDDIESMSVVESLVSRGLVTFDREDDEGAEYYRTTPLGGMALRIDGKLRGLV